jgi:hypothetical protein
VSRLALGRLPQLGLPLLFLLWLQLVLQFLGCLLSLRLGSLLSLLLQLLLLLLPLLPLTLGWCIYLQNTHIIPKHSMPRRIHRKLDDSSSITASRNGGHNPKQAAQLLHKSISGHSHARQEAGAAGPSQHAGGCQITKEISANEPYTDLS